MPEKVDVKSAAALGRFIRSMFPDFVLAALVAVISYRIWPNTMFAIMQCLALLWLRLDARWRIARATRAVAEAAPQMVAAKVKVGRLRISMQWQDQDGLATASMPAVVTQRNQIKAHEAEPLEALIYSDAKSSALAVSLSIVETSGESGQSLTKRAPKRTTLWFIPVSFSHSSLQLKSRVSVTYILVALNCICYCLVAGFDPGNLLSVSPMALIRSGSSLGAVDEPWRIISAAFMHGAWWHLLFNMLALIYLGRACEATLGRFRFIGLYFVCILGSSVLSNLAFGGAVNAVGASGAIMGLGGYLVALAYFRKDLYRSPVVRRVLVDYSNVIFLALLFGVFCARLMNGSLTDNPGHIGGFVFGFLGAWIFPCTASNVRMAVATGAVTALSGFWTLAAQRYYQDGVHSARAMLAMSRGNTSAAHREYELALGASSIGLSDTRANWFSVDSICAFLGVDTKSRMVSLYNNASWAESADGNYSLAVKLATMAVACDQDEAVLDTRGVAYMGLRDYQRARKDFNKALKLRPNYGAVAFHLAQLNLQEQATSHAESGLAPRRSFDYSPEPWEYRFGRP